MLLVAVRYALSVIVGLIGLLFLHAAVDLNFNVTGWQEEVIARQTQLKESFERTARYTESFRKREGRLPDDRELRQWAATQAWPEAAGLMATNLHLAGSGDGCYLGDEESVRGYSICYWHGGPAHWKFAPQSGDHNLRMHASDFRPSLGYAASSVAAFLIPLLLAFWLWPKQPFRRRVPAACAAT